MKWLLYNMTDKDIITSQKNNEAVNRVNKVKLDHVWKIFGPNPQYILNTISQTTPNDEILSQTGHVVAVRDVSLDIAEREIFVVMGLSGSGKSTLIRCLSRLIEPTSGQVFVNANGAMADVTAMDDNALRQLRRHTVSMVFQRFGLFPHRRVIDNVGYGLEIQGLKPDERRAKSEQVLELVGLTDWAMYYPHELSGGMQQRVGLARALAVDPEIMLCDEPFSALDPLIRRDMQNELLRLQMTLNKTIIFITHDFLEAIKLGDRIAIMKDGEIVQIGTPQQIVAHPVNDYVREFTQDVPRAKVLTAESIMQTVPTEMDTTIQPQRVVSPTTTLEALIPYVIESNSPLFVVDAQEQLVGILDQKTVLLSIGSNS